MYLVSCVDLILRLQEWVFNTEQNYNKVERIMCIISNHFKHVYPCNKVIKTFGIENSNSLSLLACAPLFIVTNSVNRDDNWENRLQSLIIGSTSIESHIIPEKFMPIERYTTAISKVAYT